MSQVDEFPLASFEDLPDDALCVICQMPALDNVSMCMTGHNACRTCADKWVRSDNDNHDKCASCRQPLARPHMPGIGATWMANTALNNLVDTFQIKCPNVSKGCTHACKLTEMTTHVKDCQWREMACKCTGCTWKGPACKWHDHMKEQDHGCHLVDMLLFTQQVCATLVDKYEANEALGDKFRTEVVEPMKTQMNCIGTGVNHVQASLTAIEGYTKPFDGSSARSKRRDRKNAKDVKDAVALATTASSERDDLKRKVDELEARPEPSPFVSEDLHTQACESRDRFFRERDEARHEAHMAQQRIHDQHQLLKKMMPQAAATCPCMLLTCSAGGGMHNAPKYLRRGPGV
jgi:hypothetical protein